MIPDNPLTGISKITLRSRDRILLLEQPMIMGILNIAPDSFYDGGKYNTLEEILKRAGQIFSEGANIIDIGAFTSRPGSKMISEKEELARLMPVLETLDDNFPDQLFSVDTFRAEVVRIAVNQFNVFMINDISGGNWEKGMFEMIEKLHVPYILMHSKGIPEVMQDYPYYENLIKEMFAYFSDRIARLNSLGVSDIIIDPGFGFGKTVEQNYTILSRLEDFRIFGLPLLVGLSRKSMIQKFLGVNAEDALNGTTALNTIALLKGANILRVHDVKQAVECLRLVKMISGKGSMEFD